MKFLLPTMQNKAESFYPHNLHPYSMFIISRVKKGLPNRGTDMHLLKLACLESHQALQ